MLSYMMTPKWGFGFSTLFNELPQKITAEDLGIMKLEGFTTYQGQGLYHTYFRYTIYVEINFVV